MSPSPALGQKIIDTVCMGVWWIAWLGTLAAVCLTDGKLNSRQMPPAFLPPSYPLHWLNTPSLTSLCPRLCCALVLSLPALFVLSVHIGFHSTFIIYIKVMQSENFIAAFLFTHYQWREVPKYLCSSLEPSFAICFSWIGEAAEGFAVTMGH